MTARNRVWLIALVLVVCLSVWFGAAWMTDVPRASVVDRSPDLDSPHDALGPRHSRDTEVGQRSVVGTEYETSGVVLIFESGAPASGLRVFAVERGGGGPNREIVKGVSRLIGETSDVGVLPLSSDLMRDDLQGLAVAVSPGSAAIFPLDQVTEGSTLQIADLVEQEVEVVLPEESFGNVDDSIVLQCESMTGDRFSSAWEWGSAKAPDDLFLSHRFESARPVLQPCYYSAVAVSVRGTAGTAQVRLPVVPSRVFAVDLPLGYELIESRSSSNFVPSSTPLSVRLQRLALRTVQVRSRDGGLWPAPSRVLLARKVASNSGEWSTKWEMRLDSRTSELDAHKAEFCIPSEHEEGAASIIVEYGSDFRLESETFRRLPKSVEIWQ